jgi:hypothetical protein
LEILFSEEVLSLENNSSILRIYHTYDSRKKKLIIAGEDREYLLKNRIPCFLHGTLHVDLGCAFHENYIYPGMFTLLLDKMKYIICYSAEELMFFAVMKIMEVDFEAAVISAINKVITGCNIYFNQFLLIQLENIRLKSGTQRKLRSTTHMQNECCLLSWNMLHKMRN